jgi:hypothetical protein
MRSNSRRGRSFRALAFAGACALLSARVAYAARPEPQTERPVRTIAIAVNGEPLDTDNPAQVVGGRVLVPLRDVFAALGIAITRSGNAIDAKLPTGTVALHVGSSVVAMDGRTVTLDAPISDLNGVTYAPLRLLVAVFGAQASYDQRGAKIEIVSAFIGRNSGAEQERGDGGTDVQGVVSAVDLDSVPPSITVLRAGTSRTISITSDAKIWTEDVTIHSQVRAKLADIRVGDAVHAILARDGRVVSVFDFYKSVGGTVAAVSPSAIVLGNGRVVTPGALTQITLNSASATLGDLAIGDYVTVRSNPESGELRQIVASRPIAAHPTATSAPGTASPAAIASVSLSVSRPLRAGESFDVTLQGTPGGTASFDIGDFLTNLPMRETTPGTYVGRFTIPDRFNVTQAPVFGRLSLGASSAPRTQATQTLSAATTPPSVGEVAPPPGQTVNNVRPSIYATFVAPTGIAIDLASIRISVNGRDVTSAATRSGNFITYSPGVDLPVGPTTVSVRVADAAGNAVSKTWTFTIAK